MAYNDPTGLSKEHPIPYVDYDPYDIPKPEPLPSSPPTPTSAPPSTQNPDADKKPELENIPGSTAWKYKNKNLYDSSKGKYHIYLYTNDRVGQYTADPYESFELAIGEAVKNGDFIKNPVTGRYEQVNPNARFIEVNQRDEFTGALKDYNSDVKAAGGNAIDLVTYIGHGEKDQLVLNAEDIGGTKSPKIDPHNIQNWIELSTMKNLAKEINVKEFHFAACLTAGPVDKGMNIAQATSKYFNAIVSGATTSIGECYGGFSDKLVGLNSPIIGNPHGLLILAPRIPKENWQYYRNGEIYNP
jgi:hypothetical protein